MANGGIFLIFIGFLLLSVRFMLVVVSVSVRNAEMNLRETTVLPGVRL
jgi:hypothetical protein